MRAIDAANFYVDYCVKHETYDYMTNLRLHKFLFYAQGWSLVIRGEPLFDDTIEACQFGPVVPSVFYELGMNWKDSIRHTTKGYTNSCVSAEDAQFLVDVLVRHSVFTACGFVEPTRMMPCWQKHYRDSEVIPLDEMLTDFQTLTPQLYCPDQLTVQLQA